jgi:hypothetical protein
MKLFLVLVSGSQSWDWQLSVPVSCNTQSSQLPHKQSTALRSPCFKKLKSHREALEDVMPWKEKKMPRSNKVPSMSEEDIHPGIPMLLKFSPWPPPLHCGLNSRLCTCKAGTLPFESRSQLIFPNSWPTKWWWKQNACFRSLSFGILCCTAIDNWNTYCLLGQLVTKQLIARTYTISSILPNAREILSFKTQTFCLYKVLLFWGS